MVDSRAIGRDAGPVWAWEAVKEMALQVKLSTGAKREGFSNGSVGRTLVVNGSREGGGVERSEDGEGKGSLRARAEPVSRGGWLGSDYGQLEVAGAWGNLR